MKDNTELLGDLLSEQGARLSAQYVYRIALERACGDDKKRIRKKITEIKQRETRATKGTK